MSTSSAPVVMDKVLEVVSALLVGKGEGGDDVQVEDGGDYSQWTADEVWILDVEEGTHDIPNMRAGRKKREETYRLVITIRVSRTDRKESRDCAFSHMAAIEDWLAENPDLGFDPDTMPTLRVTDTLWEMESNYDESHRGWRTSITLKPLVEIRLS